MGWLKNITDTLGSANNIISNIYMNCRVCNEPNINSIK